MGDYYICHSNDYVSHHGILGMKWGVRRYQNPDGSYTAAGKVRYTHAQKKLIRQAKKDAKEYARAKMYYGEGAGTRRKLINASVKQRSKDPLYNQVFNDQLNGKDWAHEADAAKGERHRKDAATKTKNVTKKVLRVAGPIALTAGSVYYAYNRDKVNRAIVRTIDKAGRRVHGR